ncbi:MAG: GTP-binding protein [Anaerolineales bacterium]|nr:GTP-binding protein [Anaerolineales bacterium]
MLQFSKKVCLLGDFAVGKTSLVRRYVEGAFEDKYLSTIGVKIDRKTMVMPAYEQGLQLTLILWDLAGSEKFSQARANYLRGSSGAILVCDFTRPVTLANLHGYASDLQKLSPGAKLVIVANKYDLINEQRLTLPQLEATASSLGAPLYLTSAKTGDAVEAAFQSLARLLIS